MNGQSEAGESALPAGRRWRLKVDDRGRVLLPDELRRALSIVPGDIVIVALDGRTVSLRGLDDSIQRAQAFVRERVSPGRSLVDELLAERAAEGGADTTER